MKVRFAVTAALLATLVSSNTAAAQGSLISLGGSWQSGWTPGVQTNEFWNRVSDDGAKCNIGFFVAGGFGPCNAQTPSAFPSPLNWSNATYLAQNIPGVSNFTVVRFSAGNYSLNFMGQIAGASPSRIVGVRSVDGTNALSHAFGAAPETYQFNTDRDWEFTIESFLPTGGSTFRSSQDRQFAAFANSNGANGDNAGEWLVGAEDNSCVELSVTCSRVSDYDFNDGFIKVSTVPEPSTYALMATGLLVIGGAARRRRATATIA